eukprot:TRINITY_DN9411_c0_g1_i11.p1 TRINITY_DN9411_c0_g1~~TRINITY_DN9411_c0_g1_i11.p1  ORF type:complete len:213 (+),score=38.23 TRINITY_DN9411_c0_g1_i11:4333-4971(+)
MSPFEAVTGYKPRMPVDLIPMSSIHRPSESANAFIHHIHALHNEIRRGINKRNEYYKLFVDSHRWYIEFQVGDEVMVRVRPERFQRFPQGIAKKLQARSTAPFKILKRLGPNAYFLDLPSDMGISSTFNVEDLVPFRGSSTPSANPSPNASPTRAPKDFDPSFSQSQFPQPTPPPPPKAHRKEIVEDILDDQLVSTRQGGNQKFLVKSKNYS